ncbi:MAG: asparaginase [Longimicrobiales bacterium]
MSMVEVVRGDIVESRHRVHVAVVTADGDIIASVGDIDQYTYYRSAAKPMQALPLVEERVVERLGLTVEELALCCASHEGEPEHVAGARSILEKAGADESMLSCGAHAPYSPEAAGVLAEAGEAPGRIHNNCSGKHAGMIALAVSMGWDPTDYHRAEHPVQCRMLEEVVRFSGIPVEGIPTGVDGCASGYGPVVRYVRSSRGPRRSCGAGRRCNDDPPFMVGGTGRTCTEVMEVAGDRVFVKLGAEGVYGAGVRGRGWGVAIKVEDGGRRAVEVALIHTLHALGALTDEEARALRAHGHPDVRNTRDEIVGELRPAFDLTPATTLI